MEKPNWDNDCEENITGYHEVGLKWSLPDRDCWVCNKCGKEEIVFNRNYDTGEINYMR